MELLTVQEVAALLRVSTVTVRRYINAGVLAVVRVGRNVRIDRAAIEVLLGGGLPAEEADGQAAPRRGVLHDASTDVLDRYHVDTLDSMMVEMDQAKRLPNEDDAWLDGQLAAGSGVLSARSSIWRHIGMFNEPGQPDDVSENKARFLAEAYMLKDA